LPPLASETRLVEGASPAESSAESKAESRLVLVQIPLGEHVGLVVGRKRATIDQMMADSGAKMWVEQDAKSAPPVCTLHVTGTAQQVEFAQRLVLAARAKARVRVRGAAGKAEGNAGVTKPAAPPPPPPPPVLAAAPVPAPAAPAATGLVWGSQYDDYDLL
jgi:hypothetical protein